MKVVCVDNDEAVAKLTLGKIYRVDKWCTDVNLDMFGSFYRITNDIGTSSFYAIQRFKLLSDIREKKLNQILK